MFGGARVDADRAFALEIAEPSPLARPAIALCAIGPGVGLPALASLVVEALGATGCEVLALVEPAMADELASLDASGRIDFSIPDAARALAAHLARPREGVLVVVGNPFLALYQPEVAVLLGGTLPRPLWLHSAVQIASRADLLLAHPDQQVASLLATHLTNA